MGSACSIVDWLIRNSLDESEFLLQNYEAMEGRHLLLLRFYCIMKPKVMAVTQMMA